MKKITCISFHGTGSGAVDDFFKEFDNCPSAPSDIECRFLQDPDGISDLEYNLIENPHRLNSGYALKRYLKFAKNMSWTYGKIFGNKWLKYSEEYVESLISDNYKGYWHGDLLLLPPITKFIYYSKRALNKLRPKRLRKPGYYNYFTKMDYWHSYITREKFLTETRNYIDKLCLLLNPNNEEFVLLDQMVATSNITRYIKYVNDLKVIVVDRDPRDLYIQQMIAGDHVLPKDPKVFAKVYRDQRNMIGDIPVEAPVLQIKFEDLIFEYEETTNKIMAFIGEKESHHVRKRQLFNPDVSIKNTQMWLAHPKYKTAAETIEKMLPEYLYPFKEKTHEEELDY
jgi:hypothetical protein